MATTVRGWTTLAEDPVVLVREYSFGPGTANTMAVGLPDGKLLIVSPPRGIPEAELRELRAAGDVVALLTNNGTHHLGLAGARAAFPSAVTYAAPAAAARIRNKGKDYGELASIETLQPLLGDKVSVRPVDGSKVGDVIVSVRSAKGALLYASDFIANIQKPPSNPVFRLIFRLTGSGPGLKVFRIFFRFYVKDRKAARDCLIRELDTNAPTTLIPAHGDVVARPDLVPTLTSMLRAAI